MKRSLLFILLTILFNHSSYGRTFTHDKNVDHPSYIMIGQKSMPYHQSSSFFKNSEEVIDDNMNGGGSYQEALQKAIANSLNTYAQEVQYQSDLNLAYQRSLQDTSSKIYDAIVIGSGPSAHAFASNAAQDNLNVALILGEHPGGAINVNTKVKNFSGGKERHGYEIMYDWIRKTEELNIPMLTDQVVRVDIAPSCFHTLYLLSGKVYQAKSIVFAQGTKPRPIPVENRNLFKIWEDDAWYSIGEFKRAAHGKKVLVVGAGIDSVNKIKNLVDGGALEIYLAIRGHTIPSHIVDLQATLPTQLRILANSELESIDSTNQQIARVRMKDGTIKEVNMIVNAIGRIANDNISIISPIPLAIDKLSGRFVVTSDMMTNVPGIFAIGDIAAEKDFQNRIIPDDGRAIIAIGKGAQGERGVARYLASKH